MNITAKQVEDEVQSRSIVAWKLRECSMCGDPLHYVFDSGRVGYDSNCSCVSYWSPIRLSSYSEVANQFNMQTHPGVGEEMWNDFITNSVKSVPAQSESSAS